MKASKRGLPLPKVGQATPKQNTAVCFYSWSLKIEKTPGTPQVSKQMDFPVALHSQDSDEQENPGWILFQGSPEAGAALDLRMGIGKRSRLALKFVFWGILGVPKEGWGWDVLGRG